MDTKQQKLEAIEQQLTLLIDLSQEMDTVQTTGAALAFTFEQLRKQIQALKADKT
jgi:hypothetical protein